MPSFNIIITSGAMAVLVIALVLWWNPQILAWAGLVLVLVLLAIAIAYLGRNGGGRNRRR